MTLYKAADAAGVDRVGVADTVGCATPRQVYELVSTLRGVVSCDIEVHFVSDSSIGTRSSYPSWR
jgi:homocitrate synthase